ncbi:MAG: PTS sugar transporter subunit IIA [Leuconostoc mesenteroides]
MSLIKLEEKNILLNQSFSNQEEYFQKITKKLMTENMVKEGYFESITKREITYPTGLYIGEQSIAIPHTDYQLSNVTAILVSVLKDSLPFQRMDDPEETVSVNVIIQLLFDSPDKQPQLLKELMNKVTNQDFLQAIMGAKSKTEVLTAFNK